MKVKKVGSFLTVDSVFLTICVRRMIKNKETYYVQLKGGNIFKTSDFKTFVYITSGKLLSAGEGTVLIKNGSDVVLTFDNVIVSFEVNHDGMNEMKRSTTVYQCDISELSNFALPTANKIKRKRKNDDFEIFGYYNFVVLILPHKLRFVDLRIQDGEKVYEFGTNKSYKTFRHLGELFLDINDQLFYKNIRFSKVGSLREVPINESLYSELLLEYGERLFEPGFELNSSEFLMKLFIKEQSMKSFLEKYLGDQKPKGVFENHINSFLVFHYDLDINGFISTINGNFLYNEINPCDNIDEFLQRTYNRIFKYVNSKSHRLCHFIISCNREDMKYDSKYYKKFTKMLRSRKGDQKTPGKSFNSVTISNNKKYFKDNRSYEIYRLFKTKGLLFPTDDIFDVSRGGSLDKRNSCVWGTGILLFNTKSSIELDFNFECGINSGIIKQVSPMNLKNPFSVGQAMGCYLTKGPNKIALENVLKKLNGRDTGNTKFLIVLLSFNDSFEANNTLFRYLKENSVTIKKASMFALGNKNKNTYDKNVLRILSKECNMFGPLDSEKNVEFYSRNYRFLAAISAGFVGTRVPIQMNDSLSELIVNGLSQLDISYHRDTEALNAEQFYSELFQLTSKFSTELDDTYVENMINLPKYIDDEVICRISARMFYFGLKALRDGVCEHKIEKIIDFVLKIEEMVEDNRDWILLFNYGLVALCLAKSGTFDLEILRILRRQLLKIEKPAFMKEYTYFDFKEKGPTNFSIFTKDDLELYKFCTGILCAGMGYYNLTFDFKILVAMFPYPTLIDSYIHLFKAFGSSILKRNDRIYDYRRIIMDQIMKMYKEEYSMMDEIDKKIFIDILSDYHENFECINIFKKREILKLLANTK